MERQRLSQEEPSLAPEVILFDSVQAGSLRQLIPTSGMILCKSLLVSSLQVRQAR